MRKFGPGFLITAAFIGPGTVTTASLAGAQFGYSLIWLVLLSIAATMVLQEMAARLGIVTQKGLAEAIHHSINQPILRIVALLLIVCAIGVGNSAYQAGNITGAAIGLQNLMGYDIKLWALAIAAFAALLLATGLYSLISTVLTLLVVTMSTVFVITFWIAEPNFAEIGTALLATELPEHSLLTAIALVGTTIVPYNLFLHASLAKHSIATRTENNQVQYVYNKDITRVRTDSNIAIIIGGLVTISIVCTAAAAFFQQNLQLNSSNLAAQLQPLLGEHAPLFFAAGLLSAGLTSAITAPLAAAYTICGVFGWSNSPQSPMFKLVWFIVLSIGTAVCFTDIKPLTAILFAQASNGLLLPIIAAFLLWVMNKQEVLGDYTNGLFSNILGGLIVLLVSLLGFYKLFTVFVPL